MTNRGKMKNAMLLCGVFVVFVTFATNIMAQQPTIGNVFGGGRKASVSGKSHITVNNTNTIANVYGGNDIAGQVKDEINPYSSSATSGEQTKTAATIDLFGGTITGSVFGGGNGDYGCENFSTGNYASSDNETEGEDTYVTGKVAPWITSTTVNVSQAVNKTLTIGSLYAGGNKASVQRSVSPTGVAILNLTKGTVGNIYGGGRMAPIYGSGTINFTEGNTMVVNQNVYGGNDIANAIGAAGAQEGNVIVKGDPVISGAVFGGGNGDYDYVGTSVYALPRTSGDSPIATLCQLSETANDPLNMGKPGVKSGYVEVAMGSTGTIAQVYGGGNAADVSTSTSVKVVSGQVTEVYGGCNQSNVGGTSSVLLDQGTSSNAPTVGTIYGGNNISGNIAGAITVDLKKGTVTDKVFGGSNGAYACNDGSEYLNPPFESSKNYTGKNIPTQGENSNITVKLDGADLPGVSIYAGGNLAPATNATVELIAGNAGTVYGGGRMAPVTNGENVVNIDFKDTYTGTIGDVFGGNDIANSVTTTTPSVLVKGNPTITRAVYGGGNGAYDYAEDGKVYELGHAEGAAAVATLCGSKPSVSSSSVTIQTSAAEGATLNTIAAVYGGCKAADVTNTTTVTLTSGSVETIYGGCNISGAVGSVAEGVSTGGTTVNVNGGKVTGAVFGGSNGDYGCGTSEGKYATESNYAGMTIPTVAAAQVNINNSSTNTNDVIANVYGGGNKAPTTTAAVSLEKGKIGNVYGGGRMAPVTNSGITFPTTSTVEVVNVFGGNDIANTEAGIAASNPVVTVQGNPNITGAVYGGGNGEYKYVGNNVYALPYSQSSSAIATLCDGELAPAVTSATVTINTNTNATGTIAAVYGGCKAADVKETTTVTLNSGNVGNLYGGCNISGAVGSVAEGVSTGGTTVNVNGGKVTGAVFGGSNGDYGCGTSDGTYATGSNYAGMSIPTVAATQVNINNSSTNETDVIANVYGGGNKASTNTANVSLEKGKIGNVYGGGRMAPVTNSGITFPATSTVEVANVFGGNDIANTEAGIAASNPVVTVQGNPTITGAVYGGGNGEYKYVGNKVYALPYSQSSSAIATLCDGESAPAVTSATVTIAANLVGEQTEFNTIAEVYGGCKAADVKETTTVTLTNGTVRNLYGGCNISGAVTGKTVEGTLVGTTVNVNGGQVTGSVFGGSNGAYACSANGKYTSSIYSGMDIPTVAAAQVNINDTRENPELIANVYAGGNLAPVSGTGDVKLVDGNIGNAYGGGRMATVGTGSVTFPTNSLATIVNVYAGNDIANDATAAENATGSVTIHGNPTITGAVFGGGNGDYDYSEKLTTGKIYSNTTPRTEVASIWCSTLDKPNMQSGSVTVDVEAVNGEDLHTIAAVYGGGNAANISDNTLVTLNSGKVTTVYGSCNKSNNGGTSTVTLPTSSTAEVGTIYGGNNISGSITGAIAVNLQGGTVTDNVFGGSNGNYGCNETVDGVVEYVSGTTYEGLSLPTNGSTITVNMEGTTLASGSNVYGGGNMAPVSNNITVNVKSGDANNIFGGGRMAPVNGSSSIVFDDNYSETIANVFAGNDIANTQTATQNTEGVVTIKGNPTITGAVFGGGNGDYTYSTDAEGNLSTVTVNGETINLCGLVKPAIKNGTVNVQAKAGSNIAAVYGGGNAANVTNDSKVNITSGNVTVVYGGCNAADVAHNAEVLLNQSTADNAIDATVGTIYGGNNVSGTINNTTVVTLTNGTVTGDVFGGSNGNYGCNDGAIYTTGDNVTTYDNTTIPVTKNTQVVVQGVTVQGNVYGGGHMAPVGTPAVEDDPETEANEAVAAAGSAEVRLVSGTVQGNAFAGGRMAPVYGSSSVEFPTTSTVTVAKVFAGNDVANTAAAASISEGSIVVHGAPHVTQIFAGGNGEYDYTSHSNEVWTIGTTETPSQKIADLCGLTKPNVKSGEVKVNMNTVGQSAGAIVDVYGGANAADVAEGTTVTMISGTVTNIYGGNNITGTVGGKAKVTLQGGQVTNVFGGGNGDYGCNVASVYTGGQYSGMEIPKVTETEVNVALGSNTMGTENNPVNIYGGGNMAPVGDGTGNGRTQVNLVSGTVLGSAFAGGRMADVLGFATICTPSNSNITIDNVYGGNDIAGSVVVNAGNRQKAGNDGNLVNQTAVDGTTELDYKNSASYVLIEGTPTIGNVYGGGNGDYNYSHTGEVWDADNTNYVHDLCQGATAPSQSSTFVDMNLTGGSVNKTFGGGNAAPVVAAVTHINGDATHGTIHQSYAGGNAATVTGSAKLALIATTGSESNNVDVIFGGNNLADMDIIPNLILTSGKTSTVYGGGNQGAMRADVTIGETRHLSTYVEINSNDINISEAVYGGCRAAEVGAVASGSNISLGGTMVKMTAGTVHDIFGGNDVASKAHYAHVEISGGTVNGNVYGGSNGKYDYNGNNIYEFGGIGNTDKLILELSSTATRAAVDSSDIQILGGTFEGNIYGGGLAGDGTYAYTNIDGEEVVLKGLVFGAGCGNVAAIGSCGSHLGNVTHSLLELKNVDKTNSTITTVYGGGHAGDAVNTDLILYPTFQKHLTYLYGGAYAANITGTAYTLIEGTEDVDAVDTVFGGNNFAGTVQNTSLNIEKGTYNTIYGAGNGAYRYKDKELAGKVISCYDTVPYSMDVVMNLGESIPTTVQDFAQRTQLNSRLKVNGNVYGGGNMGIVGKDLSGDKAIRDVTVTNEGNTTEYNEQGSIVTNIYSGVYNNHIFGGARGREAVDPTYGKWKWYGRRQLVFGYKQVNMYDGQIEHSLYGGSEFIDDGYPWLYETNSSIVTSSSSSTEENRVANATLPPTGVVNIMGGIVKKNMYGGGYLGNIYGSVYVNVGVKAIDTSCVWSRNYNIAGAPSYYTDFKPVLRAEDIYLMASVYNGSDWGEAYSSAVFNTRGFYGGESQIFVDGKGYNTSLSTTGSNLPALDINFSLIGAGTSTAGGDRNSRIIVRHYGASGCAEGGADLSKRLYSIQRADLVLLDSCFFALTGEQDAYSAYASPDYTFNRIDTLTFRGNNTIEIEDPSKYIGRIRSEQKLQKFITYDGDGHAANYNASNLVAASETLAGHAINCSDATPYCDRVENKGDNKLIIDNGTYISVRPYKEGTNDESVAYGPVEGYMFLMADNNGTSSYVYARDKYKKDASSQPVNTDDGGFYGTCEVENDFGGNDNTTGDPLTVQLPYSNASRTDNNYRVWKTGKTGGSRSRAISIVAHANVVSAPGTGCDDYKIHAYTFSEGNSYDKFAVAHATLEMPPSASGNYYKITGLTIDADNGGQIKLVQSAWDHSSVGQDGYSSGEWTTLSTNGSTTTNQALLKDELKAIVEDPNYTFGLEFRTKSNFGTVFPNGNSEGSGGCWSHSVLVGDANFTAIDGLMTNKVDLQAANGVIPTLDFNLSYSTQFNTTVIRQVILTVMEYREVIKSTTVDGQTTYTYTQEEVGPIDVTLTLATVVDDFKDMEISLLAMYNEGTSNTYQRKIVLPAAFKARNIYLNDIEWVSDLRNAPASSVSGDAADPNGNGFMLTSKDAEKTGINLFGVSIGITENVTDNIANTLGWNDIATNYRNFDVFEEATKGMTNPQACALFTASNKNYNTVYPNDPNSPYSNINTNTEVRTLDPNGADTTGKRGSNASVWGNRSVYIGRLDGRASAAIDATLHFDGNKIYNKDDTCGFVKLHFSWSGAADDNGSFVVSIRVKTRIAGDTIYIASKKNEITRGTDPAGNEKVLPGAERSRITSTHQEYARRPNYYISTLIEAMRTYKDGDVICVLDTFKISADENYTINGSEYDNLQIIRYSGSHDDAPGDGCAYRGPMFLIEGNGQFAAYNCTFNGSGNTRVKRNPTTTEQESTVPYRLLDNYNNRLCDTIWSEAPMFVVEGNGRLMLLRNCQLTNNFNSTSTQPVPTVWGTSYSFFDRWTYTLDEEEKTFVVPHGTTVAIPEGASNPIHTENAVKESSCFYPGGAIGLYKTTSSTPSVVLGNDVRIYDNCVLDNAVSRGAAIYNREGTVQIGNTRNGGDVVTVTNNYSLPTDATQRGLSFTQVNKKVMWPYQITENSSTRNVYVERTIPIFTFDYGSGENVNVVKTFTSRYGEHESRTLPLKANLSNVFLTRTKPGEDVTDKVLNDGLTNLISFNSELGIDTRVGITKWFPGTNYVGSSTHSDDNKLVRDTIKFGKLTNTKYIYAEHNFANGLFFDDSLTSYVFYHKTVSPVLIYFQRCASFKARQNSKTRDADGYVSTRGDQLVAAGDPSDYKMNPDSKCSAMLDTLLYRVQGGFYPYTYTWQCAPVSGYTKAGDYYYASSAINWTTADAENSNVRTVRSTTTPYDNSISDVSDDANEALRETSSADSCVTVNLVMRPTDPSLDYVYRVVGNDLTGNCPVSQEVDVRVLRAEKTTADGKYSNTADAYWLGKESISVDNPGIDYNLTAKIGVKEVAPNTSTDSTRARYLRLCEGVRLGVDVAPSWNDGYVVMEGHYLQQNDLTMVFDQANRVTVDNAANAEDLQSKFFCPGDELNLSTYKVLNTTVTSSETLTEGYLIYVDGTIFEGTGRIDGPCSIEIRKADGVNTDHMITLASNKGIEVTMSGNQRVLKTYEDKTNSSFMMWDFDPQAPATNVAFVMPDHNYSIKAIYSPSMHWCDVVTTFGGSYVVGHSSNGTEITEKASDGYSVDYDGNVTISNRAGLAWLISTCNGLNYQQAQEFHNKTITISPSLATDGLDMSEYLWTPLGTQSNPFSGNFQGNNVPIKGISCLENNLTYVGFFGNVGHDNPGSVIGQNGTATINQVVLDKATLKGNNYVGGIAAVINDGTKVTNNVIRNASMISGSYMVGGLVAEVNGAVTINQNTLNGVDLLGNATCAGGIVAMDNENPNNTFTNTVCGNTVEYLTNDGYSYSVTQGENSSGTVSGPATIVISKNSTVEETITLLNNQYATIENRESVGFSITICEVITTGSVITNNNVSVSSEKMESANNESGTVGNTQTAGSKGGFLKRMLGAKPAAPQAFIANNYVYFRSSGKAQVSGGLMGAASNANMVNNYVYGVVSSYNNAGALVGYVGNNVDIDRCYYQDGTSLNGGFGGGKRVKSNLAITSFTGSGNQVHMAVPGYGEVDNLTRALNDWALAQQRYATGGDTILSWRSDLLSENHGLPIFGNPDLIEVRDTTFNNICDSFYYDGAEYYASAIFKVRVIDTVKYIDSTMAFVYDVHYSQVNNVIDSIEAGAGYEGYGFSLTADEIEEMASQYDRHLFRTIEIVDSTLSAYGCDSVVILNLTIYPKVGIDEPDVEPETPVEVLFNVEVYPNPTQGGVTVESEGLESIEVYDAVSRLVIRKNGLEGDSARLDLSGFSTGVYYFRITTQHGVAIKKVIKK